MDAEGILIPFVRARVDFVVIGGVGAALLGVPMATFAVDLVHSRSPACR
jgi:hypothetical protein